MTYGDYYRSMHHSDAQHYAASCGYDAGWSAGAYGDDGTIRPGLDIVRAGTAHEYWEAYAQAREDYACMIEDDSIYGHDWTGGE